MKHTKNKYIILAIFFAALLVRLAFVTKSSNLPSADALAFDMSASSIVEGKGYVDSEGKPRSFHPPFYPFFLSVIYRLFGHSYLAVRVMQAIIGSLSCALTYLIAKALFNNKAAIIAGMLAVIYFPFIKSAELLLAEALFGFLLLLITFFLIKTSKSLEGKNISILGLLLGIATLTKAMMLFYILFLFPAFIFYRHKNSFMRSLKKYIVMFAFFAASILPWTIRNFIVYREFIPIATQGGVTLYSGYCPPGGIFGKLPGEEDPVIVEANKISSPAKQSNFLVRQTMRFIKENPCKVLKIELKKIIYFWAPFDWEIIGNKWFNLIYVLAMPFFIVGLFLILKKCEFKTFYPVLLPIFYFQIISLVFYGSPRFRLPIEPFLFIIAAIGILESYGKLVKSR